jgi:hypothetical protein
VEFNFLPNRRKYFRSGCASKICKVITFHRSSNKPYADQHETDIVISEALSGGTTNLSDACKTFMAASGARRSDDSPVSDKLPLDFSNLSGRATCCKVHNDQHTVSESASTRADDTMVGISSGSYEQHKKESWPELLKYLSSNEIPPPSNKTHPTISYQPAVMLPACSIQRNKQNKKNRKRTHILMPKLLINPQQSQYMSTELIGQGAFGYAVVQVDDGNATHEGEKIVFKIDLDKAFVVWEYYVHSKVRKV